jgi:hypothetical protein
MIPLEMSSKVAFGESCFGWEKATRHEKASP